MAAPGGEGRPRPRPRSHLTPSGGGIIGAGLVILGFAFYALNILLFLVAVLAIAFVAAEYLLFCWTTRGFGPEWFYARRENTPPKVNVHGTGSAGITVGHRGPRGFYAEIFDGHPAVFELMGGSPRLRTFFDRGDACSLAYLFRTDNRGLYTVGPTTIVAHDALGLAFRSVELDTRANLYVTPAAGSASAGSTFARLHTRFLGTSALRRRGYGTEFRSLREYLPTDDYRTIAWRRSGKGKLFVREFEQENRQDFLVLLDCSAAMAAGEPGATALDRAVEAAQVLTSYVAGRDDRISLLAWAGGATAYVPPGRGPEQFTLISRALATVQPVNKPFHGQEALSFLTEHLTTRTHVFLFTSLTDPSDPFRAAFARFSAKGHRLYAFTPSVSSFYPPVGTEVDRKAVALAQEVDALRFGVAASAVRGLGVPLFPYERGGAVAPLVALYSSIRAWGYAR